MKVVIDSNIFIICLNPLSKYNSVFTDFIKGKFKLCISTDISFEYAEIFSHKFKNVKAEMVTSLLAESNHTINTDVHFYWNLISKDPDDNKFVDCAIAGNVDYLVTNDKYFNVLKEIDFPSVQCITVDEFMEILSKEN